MPVYRRDKSWRVVVSCRGTRHERHFFGTRDDALAFEDAMRTELGAKQRRLVDEVDLEQTSAQLVYFSGDHDSWVYFVQQGDNGPIKIGYTKRKGLRLTALQNGNPERLRMVCAVPGGRALEYVLHKAFRGARLVGEWFTPTPRLVALMKELSPKESMQ